jgi:hypothetical protein
MLYKLFSVDESVDLETRVRNCQQMCKLVIECLLQADRDCSTVDAATKLQHGAERILNGTDAKESILQYMVWPAFTPSEKKGKKKEPKSPKPWQSQYQWQSQGHPPYMGQQQPPSALGMGPYPFPPQPYGNPQTSFGQPRYCNYCCTWGHSEEKCFARKAALKGSSKS